MVRHLEAGLEILHVLTIGGQVLWTLSFEQVHYEKCYKVQSSSTQL